MKGNPDSTTLFLCLLVLEMAVSARSKTSYGLELRFVCRVESVGLLLKGELRKWKNEDEKIPVTPSFVLGTHQTVLYQYYISTVGTHQTVFNHYLIKGELKCFSVYQAIV